MMPILSVILILVLVVTLIGMFVADWAFAGRAGWQDFTWKVVLASVLFLPLALLVACLVIPEGILHLPVLDRPETVASQSPTDSSTPSTTGGRPAVSVSIGQRSVPESVDRKQPGKSDTGNEQVQPRPSNATAHSTQLANHPRPTDVSAVLNHSIEVTNDSPNRSLPVWTVALMTSWIAGSIYMLIYYVIGWVRIAQLRNSAREPGNPLVQPTIERVEVQLNLSKPLTVLTSCQLSTPVVAGIARPVVLLPESLVSNIDTNRDDTSLYPALLHEAAHVARRDPIWNAMICLAVIIWWPIPTIHWMRRRLTWLREVLCDYAATKNISRADYAEAIFALALNSSKTRLGLFAVPVFSNRLQLESRIKWLLNASARSGSTPGNATRRIVWMIQAAIIVTVLTMRLVPANSLATVSEMVQENDQFVVQGVARDAQQKPVANAAVYLVAVPESSWTLPVKPIVMSTDEQGRYSFAGLESGRYMIWAETSQLTSLEKYLQGKRITLSDDNSNESVQLELRPGCGFRVSVTASDTGEPIEGAEISFGWTDIERKYQTGPDGKLSIGGLAKNRWYFVVRAKGYATEFFRTATQDLGSVEEMSFQLDRESTLLGKVVDESGEMVGGAEVSVTLVESSLTPNLTSRIESDMDGQFLIDGLPANTKVRVWAGRPGYKDGYTEITTKDSGAPASVEIVCPQQPYGGDLLVTVLDESGNPISGAEVLNRGDSSVDLLRKKTDAYGKALLQNMHQPKRGCQVVVKAKGMVPTMLKVTPGTKEKPTLETVKLSKGKSLKGTLLDPSGNAAANVRVFVNDSHRGDFMDEGDLMWPRTRTDANGQFQVHGLESLATLTIYTPQQYAPIQRYPIEMENEQTEVTINMSPAAVIRVRAIDSKTAMPIVKYNVKLGFCEPKDQLDGDITNGGIPSEMINPGTNIHGTRKEFSLGGQVPNRVYKMIVSADGYKTKTIPRVAAIAGDKAKLFDVELEPIDK